MLLEQLGGATGATGATGQVNVNFSKLINYGGVAHGFQRIARVTGAATVIWSTNIVGNPVARNDAISLYQVQNVTQDSLYGVYVSSDI